MVGSTLDLDQAPDPYLGCTIFDFGLWTPFFYFFRCPFLYFCLSQCYLLLVPSQCNFLTLESGSLNIWGSTLVNPDPVSSILFWVATLFNFNLGSTLSHPVPHLISGLHLLYVYSPFQVHCWGVKLFLSRIFKDIYGLYFWTWIFTVLI